jgi:SpoVK/Ycf46/Vps4 family AAA+-type ATPase
MDTAAFQQARALRADGVPGPERRDRPAYAESVPSVLVLDEIDALAQRRGNPRDVGELDRVVVSLLQELEHSMPQGIHRSAWRPRLSYARSRKLLLPSRR